MAERYRQALAEVAVLLPVIVGEKVPAGGRFLDNSRHDPGGPVRRTV
jgi:hypothetical protein